MGRVIGRIDTVSVRIGKNAALPMLSDQEVYELLERNGWTQPSAEWVEYARAHSFREVGSAPRPICPFCARSTAANGTLGSYVFYSTRINLRECSCGLLYSDRLLASDVIRGHFETTYKDEQYFTRQRALVFRQIAVELERHRVASGSTVLDIGGAKGHLLAALRDAHPDRRYVHSDLSRAACDYARSVFSLESYCVPDESLAGLEGTVDVLLLIDVLYYVPDLKSFVAEIGRLLSPRGIIILRVPNKLWLVRLGALWNRLRGTYSDVKGGSVIKFFNPEHLYVLSRPFLTHALSEIGFSQPRFLPAAPLVKNRAGAVAARCWPWLDRLSELVGGNPLMMPAMLVVAERSENGGS